MRKGLPKDAKCPECHYYSLETDFKKGWCGNCMDGGGLAKAMYQYHRFEKKTVGGEAIKAAIKRHKHKVASFRITRGEEMRTKA